MAKEYHIHVLKFYHKDKLIFADDTSELVIGITDTREYPLRKIFEKTGKWPTRVELEFVEAMKEGE